MKFLKTIRFDPSDLQVFETAADPDEWAIPGGFLFSSAMRGSISGKQKQAFSNGFFSVESRAFSTFVSVAEINDAERANVVEKLGRFFVEEMQAPSMAEALRVAETEATFVEEMCADVAINNIFALSRYFDDGDEIREEFRIVQAPTEPLHTRVWDVVEESS